MKNKQVETVCEKQNKTFLKLEGHIDTFPEKRNEWQLGQ